MKKHPLLEDALEIKSMRLDLERMRRFDQLLGNPSHQFETIHVGGTNGKGTVTFKLAAVLEETGKKVGVFTSPHISSYTERIQINRVPISEKEAEIIFNKISELIPDKLSFFELMTLVAFCYFAEKKVEIAVIEVGMGGRLDATNVIEPLVSVITSIGWDHMPYLGNTLEKIAFEKAGIIKEKTPIVLGPTANPRDLFEKIAAENEAPLFFVEKGEDYEEENLGVIKKTLSLLPYFISSEALGRGLKASLPCRFQEVYPNVIFDVGHNLPAMERTFERLKKSYPQKKVRALVAFSKDKDVASMLDFLEKEAIAVHVTSANHERAYNVSKIEGADPNFERAFQTAFQLAQKENQILLVSGTFFIMHQALLAIKEKVRK